MRLIGSADWDDVDAHKEYLKTEGYEHFITPLKQILLVPHSIRHLHFAPHPPIAVRGLDMEGATSIETQYYSASFSKDELRDAAKLWLYTLYQVRPWNQNIRMVVMV